LDIWGGGKKKKKSKEEREGKVKTRLLTVEREKE